MTLPTALKGLTLFISSAVSIIMTKLLFDILISPVHTTYLAEPRLYILIPEIIIMVSLTAVQMAFGVEMIFEVRKNAKKMSGVQRQAKALA